jgi:hypothetical protein
MLLQAIRTVFKTTREEYPRCQINIAGSIHSGYLAVNPQFIEEVTRVSYTDVERYEESREIVNELRKLYRGLWAERPLDGLEKKWAQLQKRMRARKSALADQEKEAATSCISEGPSPPSSRKVEAKLSGTAPVKEGDPEVADRDLKAVSLKVLEAESGEKIGGVQQENGGELQSRSALKLPKGQPQVLGEGATVVAPSSSEDARSMNRAVSSLKRNKTVERVSRGEEGRSSRLGKQHFSNSSVASLSRRDSARLPKPQPAGGSSGVERDAIAIGQPQKVQERPAQIGPSPSVKKPDRFFALWEEVKETLRQEYKDLGAGAREDCAPYAGRHRPLWCGVDSKGEDSRRLLSATLVEATPSKH